jgi:hypothetical protein
MKKFLIISALLLSIIIVKAQTTNINKDRRDVNQKYLDVNTIGIKNFNNSELLKEKIIKILKVKEHTYRTVFDDSINSLYNEDYSQVSELSKYQNKIIYLMLIRLKDTVFLNRIGKIIKEDVEDKYSEIGGIIRFNKSGKIYLRCSKSTLDCLQDEDNNDSYYISKNENALPKVGYFHLHAPTYNEAVYAGPGAMDIMSASFSNEYNMINEFIITSLKKGEFNIDYFGMDIRAGEYGLLYEGDDVKVIDLGNYIYK